MKTKLRTPITQSFNHPIPRSWPTPGTPSDLLDALVRRAARGNQSAVAGLARVFRQRLAPPGEDQPAVPWLLGALAAHARETAR